MESTTEYKNVIKNLFQALEPKGGGKVHRDTLKKNMERVSGKSLSDEMIKGLIDNMYPDENGMISTDGYFKPFSMPQFSPEEAAATRKVFKKFPALIDGLLDSKGIAAKIGYNNPQEVDKVVEQLKNCYLESLEDRLQKEPPKSKEAVLEKQAQLLQVIVEQTEDEDLDEMEKKSQ